MIGVLVVLLCRVVRAGLAQTKNIYRSLKGYEGVNIENIPAKCILGRGRATAKT